MSKQDDVINRLLILNSGGANPEDYLTPKQFERYKKYPKRFIDIDIDLVMNEKNRQRKNNLITRKLMAETKKDPRPKWSSKKYKNYGEFNKAVLNWRERNNKNYKWNKKDVVWEVRDGKRVPVDRNTNKVLKSQERGIPGFVQDHINPLVIKFSNKPFGFDYANLKGSKVYDENLGRFLTVGELNKEEKMRAEGRRTDEYEDKFETGEEFELPSNKLKVNPDRKDHKIPGEFQGTKEEFLSLIHI